VFGGIAILPSVFSAIHEGKFVSISILIAAYSIIPTLLFVRNINYTLRSYLFCIAMFIAGYIVMGNSPLISSARLWFLSATSLACLLIGGRTAFLFFLGSVALMIWGGYKVDFTIDLPVEPGNVIWIITVSTFVLINIIIVGAIYLIVYGLKKSEEEQKFLQEQLGQSQKLESVGRLAGGVAHDFNNMLNVILGHAELSLLKIDEDDKLWYNIKEIQSAAKRSASITKQLLAYARKQNISPKKINLNPTVENMLRMLKHILGEDIDIVWKPTDNLWPTKIDPSQLDQILVNLCVNAKDAIEGAGKITIETGMKVFDKEYCSKHPEFVQGDFVLLAVSDNGCGMDKATIEKLFEPFFTTKGPGKGIGLGLSTVYGIIRQNNGFVNVYSEVGQGTTFNIYLPRLVDEKTEVVNTCSSKEIVGGSETILLVEDEAMILKLTRKILEDLGYKVLDALTPKEAIALAKDCPDTLNILITDVIMPEMNGKDLAEKITEVCPSIKHIFMSGYTSNVIAHQGILEEGVAFIQKPFSRADLDSKIREVLKGD
jgi:signal transduction histidine kinase/ActR/RegA family two-component response regulator